MASYSFYEDGVTRLEAYRRLLAPEVRPSLAQRTIARLKASWADRWATWRRQALGDVHSDLPTVPIAQYAVTRAAVTVRDRDSRAVLARGVVTGRLRGHAWWKDGPLTLRVARTGVVDTQADIDWLGIRTTCYLPIGPTAVEAGDTITLIWPGPVFSCHDEARSA